MAQIEAKLAGIGTYKCAELRRSIFLEHLSLAPHLAQDYLRVAEEKSATDANRRLLSLSNRFYLGSLNLSGDQKEIRSFCRRQSLCCMKLSARLQPETAWQRCCVLLENYELAAPSLEDGLQPALNTLGDEKWWLRKIQRIQLQRLESIRRDLGLVQHRRSSYCSSSALHKRQYQISKTRLWLESQVAIDDEGNELSLLEISEHNVSNPAIRRAELMTRIRGFEEVADSCGHVGEFLTISAPSRMHSHLKNGRRNPKFDGSDVSEIQAYLKHVWSLIRAKYGRLNIKPYGFRVVEPHHDGTPHWHLLLFVPKHQADDLANVARYYALKTDGDERGAKKHRFKRITIDASKGTAAGYIAKYVAKNIDGAFLKNDLYGDDAKLAAAKIEAWARSWNIRQFDQIGGPSVTVWRELRRLSTDDRDLIEDERRAADASDWAAYCLLMCGKDMQYSSCELKPAYEIPHEVDLETGELLPKRTRHGYICAPRLIGLKKLSFLIPTRTKRFRVENRKAQAPP